jgi:peptide/nickel transport system permease protein
MDVTLLIAIATGVGLAAGLRRVSGGARFAAFWWITLTSAIATSWPAAFSALTDWTTTGRYFYVAAVPLALVAGYALLRGRSAGWGFRGPALLAGVLLAALFVVMPLRPSLIVQLGQYRAMERQAAADPQVTVDWMLRTAIPYSPDDYLRDMRDQRQATPPFPPSSHHWLGTNRNGADVASIMIHACRAALFIGFISTGIAVMIGIVIGGLMGYFVGAFDLFGMRLVEIFEAIPQLFLLIAVVAVLDADLYTMMAIIGLVSWTGYARFLRAEFLRLRHQDFVQAARATALPLRSILFRHMLPNGMTPILVSASFGVASAILAESTLSFLGIGAVDEPSWGRLLEEARKGGGTFVWWIATFPGLAIFLTVFAYNMIGEALRDAIDPHTRRASQL